MSGQPPKLQDIVPQAVGAIWANRWTRILLIIFFAFEIYNNAVLPAFRGTFETMRARDDARSANAVADAKTAIYRTIPESPRQTGKALPTACDFLNAHIPETDNSLPAEQKAYEDKLHMTQLEASLNDFEPLPTLLSLANDGLLAGEFQSALDVSICAHAIDPANLTIEAYQAHALMFLGRATEAKALYLKNRGRTGPSLPDGKNWDQAVLEDFATFQSKNITSPLMADIKRTLAQ